MKRKNTDTLTNVMYIPEEKGGEGVGKEENQAKGKNTRTCAGARD